MRHVTHLLRDNRGLALVEFALVVPFLIVLMLGGVELGRYILILQKVEKAVYVLTDIVSQFPPVTNPATAGQISVAQMNTVFDQYDDIMQPYDAAARQSVIMTSIRRVGVNKQVQWQIAGGGSLTQDVTSVVNGRTPSAITAAGVGVRGTNTSFPAAIEAQMGTMPDGENMIVGEVFFRYQPFLRDVLMNFDIDVLEVTLRRNMFFRPRNGNLLTLPPTFP